MADIDVKVSEIEGYDPLSFDTSDEETAKLLEEQSRRSSTIS